MSRRAEITDACGLASARMTPMTWSALSFWAASRVSKTGELPATVVSHGWTTRPPCRTNSRADVKIVADAALHVVELHHGVLANVDNGIRSVVVEGIAPGGHVVRNAHVDRPVHDVEDRCVGFERRSLGTMKPRAQRGVRNVHHETLDLLRRHVQLGDRLKRGRVIDAVGDPEVAAQGPVRVRVGDAERLRRLIPEHGLASRRISGPGTSRQNRSKHHNPSVRLSLKCHANHRSTLL